MTSLQQKESLALNSLHDISDYTSYIDQRIIKLSLLYQTLSNDKTSKKDNSKFKIISDQATNARMYSTVQERFSLKKKDPSVTLEPMNRTQYIRKSNRYAETSQPFNSLQSNSYHISNEKSLQTGKKSSKSQIKSVPISNKDKLKDYEQIKQQILSTFYIGRNSSNSEQFQAKYKHRGLEFRQNETKFKKRRLWRGRAPVKIIQKFS